jgi:hypothetical protein
MFIHENMRLVLHKKETSNGYHWFHIRDDQDNYKGMLTGYDKGDHFKINAIAAKREDDKSHGMVGGVRPLRPAAPWTLGIASLRHLTRQLKTHFPNMTHITTDSRISGSRERAHGSVPSELQKISVRLREDEELNENISVVKARARGYNAELYGYEVPSAHWCTPYLKIREMYEDYTAEELIDIFLNEGPEERRWRASHSTKYGAGTVKSEFSWLRGKAGTAPEQYETFK